MSDSLAGAFQTVLVPVSNPETAARIVRFAVSLTDGATGRLIVLFIPRDPEKDPKTVALLDNVVAGLRDEGCPVELKIQLAPSVARGVLDEAREEDADLLVLGVGKPRRGQPALGGIVESVASVSPCDVVIYRDGGGASVERIVIPVDGSDHNAAAARIGVHLGNSLPVPVEAVHVQDGHYPEWEGRGRIEGALAGLPGQETVRRTVVPARDPATGLLSRLTAGDLTVISASDQTGLERWLTGSVSGAVLDKAPGAVALVRPVRANKGAGSILSRITPTLTRPEKQELVWQATEMASWNIDFAVLILISSLLAMFGLLMNSPAVIIGAMLVAPLMQPLIGLAAGLATGVRRLVTRAFLTLAQGVALALAVSIVVGLLYRGPATPEMLARGNPGWLDVGVALAAGFIGAYATARKDIPAALAGVAIAAALMPPLCTVGLGIGMGYLALARGAGVLFLINISSISLAALLVFLWLGLRPASAAADPERIIEEAV